MEIVKGNKTALVFGATGLVGHHLVNFLLEHTSYAKVMVFVRKKMKLEHSKLEQYLVDFDRPASFSHLVKGEDLFCCLGTTMAKSGSKAAFYKVDFIYTYEAAQMAARNGANQLLLVSSVGADKDALIYYSRVKGEIEEAIQKLPFWSIHIFRPSVLLGERNENRWGEEIAGKLGKFIDRFTGGLLSKYRPIEADVVAKAMVNAAQGLNPGIHFYPSHWLQDLATDLDQRQRLSGDEENG